MSGLLPGGPVAVVLPPGAIKLPRLTLQPITEAANQQALAAVREGYSNKVGLGVSTADGGTAYLKGSIARDRLQASGYLAASRQGVAAGGEITFDLSKQ